MLIKNLKFRKLFQHSGDQASGNLLEQGRVLGDATTKKLEEFLNAAGYRARVKYSGVELSQPFARPYCVIKLQMDHVGDDPYEHVKKATEDHLVLAKLPDWALVHITYHKETA